MMLKKTVAIHTGPDTHLDHLAPLCALLEIPLIVTEEDHLELGQKFYPMVEIRYLPLEELTLAYMATHFDVVVECGKFWAIELKPLIKLLFNKDLRVIFAPHGNSDKESFLNHPIHQDIDLAYGPQMLGLKTGSNVVETGNLRLWFYQKHKAHFDRLSQEVFASFDPKKKTILYAPTWNTLAAKSSFFDQADAIISSLHKEYNLLIKLHPLLEENHPGHFHRILGTYQEKATFLLRFPPVYPLLEKTDIYLGDHSSIGYDFLYYNRPLFFLQEGGKLQQCGEIYAQQSNLQAKQEECSSLRSKLYLEAFGKCAPEDLKEKIKALL